VRVFSETIVTGESAAPKAILDDKKRDAIETALGNAAGVKGAVYKPELQAYEIQYCGPYEGLDGVKNAFVTTGTPSEMISPLEIVFRPNRTPIQELDKLKKALKQIPGVAEVVQSGNLFRCFATLDNDPRDIAKTAAAAGYEGEVLSHEVVSFKLSGAGKHEEAGSELASCKYVVRVFIDEDEATCLCVKGRVTRALLKSVLQKCGFKVR
jgi:copper chaperone CopZ